MLTVPKINEEKQISLKISEKSHDGISGDNNSDTQKLTSIASEEDLGSFNYYISLLIQ